MFLFLDLGTCEPVTAWHVGGSRGLALVGLREQVNQITARERGHALGRSETQDRRIKQRQSAF